MLKKFGGSLKSIFSSICPEQVPGMFNYWYPYVEQCSGEPFVGTQDMLIIIEEDLFIHRGDT